MVTWQSAMPHPARPSSPAFVTVGVLRLIRQIISVRAKPSCSTGVGSQNANRWGDYSMTTIDPSDGMTFWHANEYYSAGWKTRIGKFNFQGGGVSPTPTPTATPSSCSWAAGPDMPMADTRSVGVFFPANGKFYVMGGRDVNNVELTTPFEYDPAATAGRPSQPLTPTRLPTTWRAAC